VELRGDVFEPKKVATFSAAYVKEEGAVHLNWADPNGVVSLRYLTYDRPEDVANSVGNQGAPFIAANRYYAEDLANYEGYLLESISFMRGMNVSQHQNISIEPVFRWFASQDGERIFDAEVGATTAGVWNTIKLDQPIPIDVTKSLYYGVEVVEHDPRDLPVATGYDDYYDKDKLKMVKAYDGRGNLFSYDGGSTWQALSDELKGNAFEAFFVRATLVPEINRQPQERLRRYYVYRNGIELALVPLKNNFTDTIPLLGVETCYEIKCQYDNLAFSDEDMACITINGVGLVEVENGLKVYPNLISQNETITVETSLGADATIRIFDRSGKLVKTVKIRETMTPVQMNVAPGVYFLKIEDRETVKLIVK
jgi:hypothetical protein